MRASYSERLNVEETELRMVLVIQLSSSEKIQLWSVAYALLQLRLEKSNTTIGIGLDIQHLVEVQDESEFLPYYVLYDRSQVYSFPCLCNLSTALCYLLTVLALLAYDRWMQETKKTVRLLLRKAIRSQLG